VLFPAPEGPSMATIHLFAFASYPIPTYPGGRIGVSHQPRVFKDGERKVNRINLSPRFLSQAFFAFCRLSK
jgi:hypothetical protein